MTQKKPEKESFEAPGKNTPLLIACAQAAAIIPGISRSGSTVAAGVFQDVPRRRAFTFSFMLSIPAILGAGVLELRPITANKQSYLSTELLRTWCSILLAGLLSLSLFSIVIKKAQLRWFGYYAILVGILTLFLFLDPTGVYCIGRYWSAFAMCSRVMMGAWTRSAIVWEILSLWSMSVLKVVVLCCFESNCFVSVRSLHVLINEAEVTFSIHWDFIRLPPCFLNEQLSRFLIVAEVSCMIVFSTSADTLTGCTATCRSIDPK